MYEEATTLMDGSICEGEVEHPVRLQKGAELHRGSFLGAFGFLNVGSVVYGGVSIGRYLSCGRGCEVGVTPHPFDFLSSHGFGVNNAWFPKVPGYGVSKQGKQASMARPTVIGHDVWIGAQAIIIAGVTIGTGAVVAANAVVTRDIAPYEIVAGVPARKIKYRFDEPTRHRLLKSAWWELPFGSISKLPFRDIAASLDIIEKMRAETDETPQANEP